MSKENFMSLSVLVLLCLLLVTCTGGTQSHKGAFSTALDFKSTDRWVVLSRPNSIWSLGTVIEIKEGGTPEDIGNVLDLNCFPEQVIIETSGEAPSSAYATAIDYGLSLSATLGLPSQELVKVGLNFGDDGQDPNHKTVLRLDKAIERRWSFVKLEEYVAENFTTLSRSCKSVLMDPNRHILDKIYQINKGSFEIVDKKGAKVDLSTPKFKAIADAAASAGFKVTNQGSLIVTEEAPPMTFAVRAADFEKVLTELGIKARGSSAQSFEKAMKAAGASVSY